MRKQTPEILKEIKSGSGKKVLITCIICGKRFWRINYYVSKKNSRACGELCRRLLVSKQLSARNRTHGLSKHPLYQKWKHMKARCENEKNKKYYRYGGRKITICKRWHLFENFYEDLFRLYNRHVKKYGERNTTIDRINNDGNYCRKNVRFATYYVQQHNKKAK